MKKTRATKAKEERKAFETACTRPSDIIPIINKLMIDWEQEQFIVVCMNIRNMVLSAKVVGLGSARGVEAHPREIFREAVRSSACAIVLAHNHPSGDPSPSTEDIELTKRLRQVGNLLGIPVIDHVIFTANGSFRSLAELNPAAFEIKEEEDA